MYFLLPTKLVIELLEESGTEDFFLFYFCDSFWVYLALDSTIGLCQSLTVINHSDDRHTTLIKQLYPNLHSLTPNDFNILVSKVFSSSASPAWVKVNTSKGFAGRGAHPGYSLCVTTCQSIASQKHPKQCIQCWLNRRREFVGPFGGSVPGSFAGKNCKKARLLQLYTDTTVLAHWADSLPISTSQFDCPGVSHHHPPSPHSPRRIHKHVNYQSTMSYFLLTNLIFFFPLSLRLSGAKFI